VDTDIRERYRRDGYAVVRKVFDGSEIAALAEAFDRIYRQGLGYPSSYRDHNVFFNLALDPALGKIVRMVQWPSYFDEVLARFRTDSRMAAILAPLIGRDLKQIINQLHWKPPGAARVDFGYHQDVRFRRPRDAYRHIERSYVQTGIAVDPHRADNGAMVVFPGSHRLVELQIETTGRVMETEPDARALGGSWRPSRTRARSAGPASTPTAAWFSNSIPATWRYGT
jgi:ectoine hydroxylase-related dioxygenase (phytanoyl-CoA dioxygenase family)